jgi:hypothetical protein
MPLRLPGVLQKKKNHTSAAFISVLLTLFIYSFIHLVVLGFELRAYTLNHFTSPFCDAFFFKIGSRELFAPVGFEPGSS